MLSFLSCILSFIVTVFKAIHVCKYMTKDTDRQLDNYSMQWDKRHITEVCILMILYPVPYKGQLTLLHVSQAEKYSIFAVSTETEQYY